MTRRAFYNEIDAFCCDVLRARIADGLLPPGDVDARDIRLVNPEELKHYGQVHLFAGIGGGALACRLAGVPDDFRIITAGVPCQPASVAGRQGGATDERWLWPDALRVLRVLGSHVALLENPTGLLALRGGVEFGGILGELAESGRDVEWDCIPASSVGAPHQRDRVWIIAHPIGYAIRLKSKWDKQHPAERGHAVTVHDGAHGHVADTVDPKWRKLEAGVDDAHRSDAGREEAASDIAGVCEDGGARTLADADRARLSFAEREALRGAGRREEGRATTQRDWWATEPDVGRVAHGVPARVDRLRALGNAWVPQAAIPALHVILAHHAERVAALDATEQRASEVAA